ncbi:MAG TPA: hypothetical protein VMF66_17985 [Candidatus Acidoferrum sp.]|nr:hypothetical protein [Candidatus Acidoferrum sp.]
MAKANGRLAVSAVHNAASGRPLRPLSALLSQVLVAFTVEFDNEFERQMAEAGDRGARLSLVVWANLLRFVSDGALAVHELAARAMATQDEIRFRLGCLERWRFVVLEPGDAARRPAPTRFHRLSGRERRAGWGSGRGISADWVVRLTSRGLRASRIWPPLFDVVEQRWEKRFGKDEIDNLRTPLLKIADRLEMDLPEALPPDRQGRDDEDPYPHVARKKNEAVASSSRQTLPTLLSRLLLAFRLEFDRESPAPLSLCANTIRVLDEKPIRLAEIPRLTGGSPEATDIGWQIKPYVAVMPDPAAKRGKVVCLSPPGLEAQRTYLRLVSEIESRWEKRFGKQEVNALRRALESLFDRHNESGPLLSEGLEPPEGTVRAGDEAPALGRREPGPAALQRARDLVAQTQLFISDPAGSLPHYPLWDMNRGFGP